MEEEETLQEQTTTDATTSQQTTEPPEDKSLDNMRARTAGTDYINKGAEVGKKGADALKDVEVQHWNPVSYRMLKDDPELKGKKGLLVGNALLKGLEGALSTKASGRDFDPTTAMSEYNQAERDRYIGNVTDKENAIYEAQKQPIENAISAAAQGAIATEDAALNSYIQDYVAEKDQDRKFALLQQVMAQAGLTDGVDENGNPIFKAWTDLDTPDLLKLNQLMQYLSGDTSVMNLLVGQYGPDIVEKLQNIFKEMEAQGGFGNWLRNIITGEKAPVTEPTTGEPVLSATPQYSIQEVLDGASQTEDPELRNKMSVYKNARLVNIGGTWFDVSDISDTNLDNIAKALSTATSAVQKGAENSIKDKLKALDKNRYKDILNKLDIYKNNYISQNQPPSTPIPPVDVGAATEIDTQMAQLSNDSKGTQTSVDTASLREMINNSELDDTTKQEYLDNVDKWEGNIAYNKKVEETNAREKDYKKKVAEGIKEIDKKLKDVKGVTNTNYAKKGSYENALTEASAIYSALKSTGEQQPVIYGSKLGSRLKEIAETSQKGGRFEKEDAANNGLLSNYLEYLNDASHWGE